MIEIAWGHITERDLKNIHILNACECSVNAQSTKSSSIFSSICSCSREILREIKTFRTLDKMFHGPKFHETFAVSQT